MTRNTFAMVFSSWKSRRMAYAILDSYCLVGPSSPICTDEYRALL